MQNIIVDELYSSKKDSCRMRRAVRAVIYQADTLLMVHSKVNGDYKFPGGGIEQSESDADALKREVKEETGFSISSVGEKILCAYEYRYYDDDEFVMESNYYLCSIDTVQGEQNLDEYEKDLGFIPVFIANKEAYKVNVSLLGSKNEPSWTKRETMVLEELAKV